MPDHEGKWVIHDSTPKGENWDTGKKEKHGLTHFVCVCVCMSLCFTNVDRESIMDHCPIF